MFQHLIVLVVSWIANVFSTFGTISSHGLPLFVQLPHHDSLFPLDLPMSATVRDLATMIVDECHLYIDVKRLELIFAGKRLRDLDAELADIGISAQCTLEARIKQPERFILKVNGRLNGRWLTDKPQVLLVDDIVFPCNDLLTELNQRVDAFMSQTWPNVIIPSNIARAYRIGAGYHEDRYRSSLPVVTPAPIDEHKERERFGRIYRECLSHQNTSKNESRWDVMWRHHIMHELAWFDPMYVRRRRMSENASRQYEMEEEELFQKWMLHRSQSSRCYPYIPRYTTIDGLATLMPKTPSNTDTGKVQTFADVVVQDRYVFHDDAQFAVQWMDGSMAGQRFPEIYNNSYGHLVVGRSSAEWKVDWELHCNRSLGYRLTGRVVQHAVIRDVVEATQLIEAFTQTQTQSGVREVHDTYYPQLINIKPVKNDEQDLVTVTLNELPSDTTLLFGVPRT